MLYGVRFVFREIENILSGSTSADQIRLDIQMSNALFLLLSPNVQDIPHTRDWVVWEAGVGHSKPIWVFEPWEHLGTISVVTPHLNHYVVFAPIDEHMQYIQRIIQSYSDTNVLRTIATTTAVGGALGKGPGGAAGLVVGVLKAGSDQDKRLALRPPGIQVNCAACNSFYSIHLPEGLSAFRCPVCNERLALG